MPLYVVEYANVCSFTGKGIYSYLWQVMILSFLQILGFKTTELWLKPKVLM